MKLLSHNILPVSLHFIIANAASLVDIVYSSDVNVTATLVSPVEWGASTTQIKLRI